MINTYDENLFDTETNPVSMSFSHIANNQFNDHIPLNEGLPIPGIIYFHDASIDPFVQKYLSNHPELIDEIQFRLIDESTVNDYESTFNIEEQILFVAIKNSELSAKFVKNCRMCSYNPMVLLKTIESNIDDLYDLMALGADDIFDTNSDIRILDAKLQATMKRIISVPSDRYIQINGWIIDLKENLVVDKNGRVINFPPKEFKIFKYLYLANEHVLNQEEIMLCLGEDIDDYGNEENPTNFMAVAIRRIRQKIEKDPSKPNHIITEPWHGYKFIS